MGLRTAVCDLPHLHPAHVVPQRPAPIAYLHRLAYCGAHELFVDRHAPDDLEVRVEPCEQPALALDLPLHNVRDTLEYIRDGELVQVEGARCDAQRGVLVVQGAECVFDVLVVGVRRVQVGGGELRYPKGRCRGD